MQPGFALYFSPLFLQTRLSRRVCLRIYVPHFYSYDVQGDAESHVIVFEQYKLRGLFGQLPPENHELWESVFARGQFKMVTYENGTSAPMERLLQPHELSMADRAFFMYAEAASFLFKPAASVIKTAVSALPKDLSKKITEKSEITTLDDLKSACRSKG